MNDSFFQDYAVSERPEENVKFMWSIPELIPGNSDVLFLFFFI